MSLDTLVSVTVNLQNAQVEQAGFGVPLVAAYFPLSVFPQRVKEYAAATALADMVDDGLTASHPAYLAMQSVLSQNPKVTTVKLGRKANPSSQAIRWTPVNLTEDFVHTLTVEGTLCSYTNGSGESVAGIVTAMQALADAVTGADASDDTTHLTITPTTTNDLISVVSTADHADAQIEDLTADPGLAADLNAIVAEDAAWYGLLLDSNSAAEVAVAAAWAEARNIVFGATTQDSECKSAAVTDCIASTLQDTAYTRTFLMFHENPAQYAAAAWMGERFPSAPGSSTWAFKTPAGVTVSALKSAEIAALKGKACNYLIEVKGNNITLDGVTPSGEFIDVTRGIDWDRVRRQERLFTLLLNNPKVPYTDAGIAMVEAEMRAQNDAAVDAGLAAADPVPTVTVPRAADVSAANKAARALPDVGFSYTLAGAVHSVAVTGSVSA